MFVSKPIRSRVLVTFVSRGFGGGHAKQDIDQGRQGGVGNIVNELKIVFWLAGVERIFVFKPDHQFIHEGHGKPRELLVSGRSLAVG